jgi:hypothetical protein
MTINLQFVEPRDFVAYVKSRGYRAEPLYTIAYKPARLAGYSLRGPRGAKKTVIANAEGQLPLFDAQLFCDGWDYTATRNRGKRA